MVWKYCPKCRKTFSTLRPACLYCGGELKDGADAYSRSKGAFRKKTSSKSIRRKSSSHKRNSK